MVKTENDTVTKWREVVIEEGNKIINGVTNLEVLKALDANYIRSKHLEIKDDKLQIMDKVFTTDKILK